MRTKGHIFQDIDWVLVGIYLLFMAFGWLSIYAATFDEDHRAITDMSMNHGKQLLWIGLALVVAVSLLLLDQQFFETFAYIVYGISIALLLAVLVFGSEIKGAQSWFVMGPISFQPSEVAKYGTALALARYLKQAGAKFNEWRVLLGAVLIIGLPAAIIMLQPDVGSTLVFLSLSIVLYRQGLSGWIFIIGTVAIVLFIVALFMKQHTYHPTDTIEISGTYVFLYALIAVHGLAYYWLRKKKGALFATGLSLISMAGFYLSVDYVFDNVLKPHHQNRINELLGIVSDPRGVGYNVHQSKIAIGSGGFSGKGFLEGTQTKFHFVPEQSTDFIFCTVGEEWGFLGAFLVVALFVLLIARIIWLAEKQRSTFTRIYGYCVASILFIHFAINIGMVIGVVPVIGIPLPFFSYGGSSLWTFTILLFSFIKLDSERKFVLR